MKALNIEEIKAALEKLSGWELGNNCIKKNFSFKNFSANFAFMTRVAMLAEKHEHHPDWSGGYNKLTIELSTHDVNGVSEKDFALASAIEKCYSVN